MDSNTCTKLTIAYALDTFIHRTCSWIYNHYVNVSQYNIHVFASTYQNHPSFPLKNGGSISLFPGYEERGQLRFPTRVYRWMVRLLLVRTKLDMLYFFWVAKRRSVRLIHCHFANIGYKYLILARLLRIPLVVSFYGYDYDEIPNRDPKWIKRYRKLFERATLFLTEGEFGRKSLVHKGCSPHKVVVHHLGVNVDLIPFVIRKRNPDDILMLIQIASFVEKKGHRTLLKAMNILKNSGVANRVLLTLIGDGILKNELVELAASYDLSKYVRFLNHIEYGKLHTELLKHHVFVHPSHTTETGDCEGGAPVVLLDAQATGMPVIATFHCDIPEEVVDGKTGILVSEQDPEALASAIMRFLEEPNLLSKYGRAGRQHVIHNYSSTKQASILEALYARRIGSSC